MGYTIKGCIEVEYIQYVRMYVRMYMYVSYYYICTYYYGIFNIHPIRVHTCKSALLLSINLL